MLSKQKAKYIKSLQIKKYRNKHRSFLVEGAKNVLEVLHSDFKVEILVALEWFVRENESLLKLLNAEIIVEKQAGLESISSLKTNDAAIAVVKMPEQKELSVKKEVILMLDNINDPGNLGTIIRTADWYGINKIVASPETVDAYHPKVIQSSMGSFTRVDIYYENLDKFINENHGLYLVGTTLDGNLVQNMKIQLPMAILFGNESNGISMQYYPYLKDKIAIPKYGNAESLNVAISVAIVCDNLRRIQGNLKK